MLLCILYYPFFLSIFSRKNPKNFKKWGHCQPSVGFQCAPYLLVLVLPLWFFPIYSCYCWPFKPFSKRSGVAIMDATAVVSSCWDHWWYGCSSVWLWRVVLGGVLWWSSVAVVFARLGDSVNIMLLFGIVSPCQHGVSQVCFIRAMVCVSVVVAWCS